MADYGLEEIREFAEAITHYKDADTVAAEVQSMAELRRHLIELETHPGFLYFRKKLLEQLTARLSSVFCPPEGLDSLVNGPYNSGEIAGIKLAVDLVKVLSDTIKELIEVEKTISEQQEPENEENS